MPFFSVIFLGCHAEEKKKQILGGQGFTERLRGTIKNLPGPPGWKAEEEA